MRNTPPEPRVRSPWEQKSIVSGLSAPSEPGLGGTRDADAGIGMLAGGRSFCHSTVSMSPVSVSRASLILEMRTTGALEDEVLRGREVVYSSLWAGRYTQPVWKKGLWDDWVEERSREWVGLLPMMSENEV